MGKCYLEGNGIRKNYDSAIMYFKKACDKGNVDAKRLLKYCIDNGYDKVIYI